MKRCLVTLMSMGVTKCVGVGCYVLQLEKAATNFVFTPITDTVHDVKL